jgi:hypothetical protein
VIDDNVLAFPNYDGNGQYVSMGNLVKKHNVGMLLIDFESPRRLRVQGEVQIQEDDELLSTYPGVQFIVRVRANEVFPNCPRCIDHYGFQETSEYVPAAHYERRS